MQKNIAKVAERGERLDDLQDKTGEWVLRRLRAGWSEAMSGLLRIASDRWPRVLHRFSTG